jgi:hypothetical protein
LDVVSFSPDDQRVLIGRRRHERYPNADLGGNYLVPLDGSSPPVRVDEQFTFLPVRKDRLYQGLKLNPWSPDWQQFIAKDGNTLCILSATSGEPVWSTKPLPSNMIPAYFAWAPNGRHVAYLVETSAFHHSAATQHVRIVACQEPHVEFTVPIGLGYPINVFWSPDGSRLAVRCAHSIPLRIYLLDFGGEPVSKSREAAAPHADTEFRA